MNEYGKCTTAIVLHVLKYNGTLHPCLVTSKYHEDLLFTRKLSLRPIPELSAESLAATVRVALGQSLPGYWGDFCWQFPLDSLCSHYQSLLDDLLDSRKEDFSLLYVVRRWGQVFVRLTSAWLFASRTSGVVVQHQPRQEMSSSCKVGLSVVQVRTPNNLVW